MIAKEGASPKLGSVNKQQWHLAIFGRAKGPMPRAAWLDYDSGGGHGHRDGMNLGLFAKGLDLMPDFGYPPVQFGGWGSPKARLVYDDGRAQHGGGRRKGPGGRSAARRRSGPTASNSSCIRASAAALIGGQQYERTVATIDISDRDFYLLDIFRVVGGRTTPSSCTATSARSARWLAASRR